MSAAELAALRLAADKRAAADRIAATVRRQKRAAEVRAVRDRIAARKTQAVRIIR